LEQFKENWWTKNPNKKNCEESEQDSGGGISIYNIGGVFIIIFVGIGLAICTLVFEYLYHKEKRQPQVPSPITGKPTINKIVPQGPPLQVKEAGINNLQKQTSRPQLFRSRTNTKGPSVVCGVNPW